MQRIINLLLAAVFAVQATVCLAGPADDQKADALFAALGMPELLQIMRIEGLEHGTDIAVQVLGDRGHPSWDGIVSTIYATEFMTQEIRAAFDEELQGCDMDAMLAFFTTEPGQTIISLEISARRAMLDPFVDATAKEAAALAWADDAPRAELIAQIITVNHLIDSNVAGALNANYAFTLGLMDGGALPSSMSPDDALAQVWAQEPEIRRNTTEWLNAYLLLAFRPLPDDALAAYLEFSRSEPGRDLNNALSVAFEGLFSDISRALGLASARFITSEEL